MMGEIFLAMATSATTLGCKGLEENKEVITLYRDSKTKHPLLLRSANQMNIMAHCFNKFHHLPPGQAVHN